MPALSSPAARPRRTLIRLLVGLTAMAVAIAAPVAAPAAHAASIPVVDNGDFSELTPEGGPAGWGAWNAAGSSTVTVLPGAAPGGGNAVSITSTSGTTARYALTQNVNVDASSPRKLVVRAFVKGDNLGTGWSAIRVQAFDAAGVKVLPLVAGAYLRGTFDWLDYEVPFTLPDSATRISIEAMLDRAPGTVTFAQVRFEEQQNLGTLVAEPTTRGAVELRWTFPDIEATSYAVYRGSPTIQSAVQIRTTTAPTVGDENVEPDTVYEYRVEALGPDGTALGSTRVVRAQTPTAFDLSFARTMVVAGESGDGGNARVSWAVAAGVPTAGLTLVNGEFRLPVIGVRGSADVPAAVGDRIVLVSGEQEIGDAVVGSGGHPRSIMTTAAVQTIRENLASGAPNATGAWDRLVARLANPQSAGYFAGSGGFYQARDAAFAFAVTGDQSYAEQAYTSAMSAESFIKAMPSNMGLELARPAALLPNVYDWAYQGWTEQQRESIRMLMLRTSELLSTYHHGNIDGPNYGSNWAGIVRTTELAMLLALRGDPGTPDLDRRILSLADQVGRHLDDGYSDVGWNQEGWDYFHYTQLYMFPSIFFAQGAGLTGLDEAFNRPDFVNLALHAVSSRALGDTGQYGVSGPNRQVDGTFPLLFPLADASTLPGLVHLYDSVHGVESAQRGFDGLHGLWSILYYPGDGSVAGAPTSENAHRAVLDDENGFALFRDRYQSANDNIIVTSNRNKAHSPGWSAAETFSLSWIGDDTTWALLGGRAYTDPLQWSKPLVDGRLEAYVNQYATVDGKGVTLESRAFDRQGGGYLSLDGSKNFAVDKALREEVVDFLADDAGGVSTIVAINDTFADDTSHRWDWQLRPEAGVTIQINADSDETEPLFTFTSTDATGGPVVLSGFVLDREGLTAQTINGTLRLSREGTNASFKIVLATAEAPLTARLQNGEVVVSQRIVPVDRLGEVPASGLMLAPSALKSISLAQWERTYVADRRR